MKKSRNEYKKNHTIIDWINSVSTKPKPALNNSKKIEQPDFIINNNINNNNEFIPWVEKYRPNDFKDIILSDINRIFFKNIIEKNHFPHLLLYGPPGIGKTTAAISLINEYQKKYSQTNKYNVMHLNASDERGVDTIRIQINQFVNSMNLFESGVKLIILDEVDYMTITAQKALKTLIQSCRDNVKFCIICNYISKIDESLKNEFINIRFNQLPQDYTLNFIKKIAIAESVDIDNDTILSIQKIYETDIRSTINFIQLNRALKQEEWKFKILNDEVFQYIHSLMLNYNAEKDEGSNSMDTIIEVIHNTLIRYNIDNFTFIQKYFKYIIKNHTDLITEEFLTVVSHVIHDSGNIKTADLNRYVIHQISKLL